MIAPTRRLGYLVLLLTALGAGTALGPAKADAPDNGVDRPDHWPPRLGVLPDALPTPTYLRSPPAVIAIDVGRQLFIDDFLIERTDMARRFERPVEHPANPILKADREWEQADGAPMAIPYSGGVWCDPADGKFKAWYMGGYNKHLCYAESQDGVTWTKPQLDVVPGTNIVIPNGATESNTLWLDQNENDPRRRFKYFTHRGGAIGNLYYRASRDGIHDWTGELWKSGRCGDRSTVFYNPHRNRWVINIRESYPPDNRGRARRYWEVADINDPAAVAWPAQAQVPLWVTADRGLDAPNVRIGFAPQLYHLDCLAYESVLLGMFTILRGYFHADSSEGRLVDPGRPKHNDIGIGFSRDGFQWQRPDHAPFLALSETKGDWNWGNMQSVGGGLIVVGDQLLIYYSGRAGESRCGGNRLSFDAAGSTGVAVLRRDGFARMEATGGGKSLTTRPVRFLGKHLFVNVDAAAGELRAEVLDGEGCPIAPFTRENCHPVRVNKTLQQVTWDGAADLASLTGRPVRFRFHLSDGSLYAFWVSPEATGASHGYVGAGGPGFTSSRDTVGSAAYRGNRPPLANAGADRVVRSNGPGAARVSLDASRSLDNDGTLAAFEWREHGAPIAAGRTATIDLAEGRHTITLAVRDDAGAVGYDHVTVTVLPQAEPLPPRRRLALWLKADAITGLDDGAPVPSWPDSSGNGLDPAQTVAAKRPVWVRDAAHGQPAVRFDGKDDMLWTSYYRDLLFTSYNVSVFAVFRASGDPRARGLVSANWTSLGISSDRGASLVYATAYPLADGGIAWKNVHAARPGMVMPDRWALGSLIRSGDGAGQTRLFVDGVRNDDGAAIPYHSMNTERGAIGCLRGETGCWEGDIAEVLLYGEALTEPERSAVEIYLSRKYTLTRPPAH